MLCVYDVYCAEKKTKRIAKGLLMPLLAICYVLTCNEKEININFLILGALFFGWIGDIALIHKTKKRVLVGILTFLVGHIFYILLFLHDFTGFTVYQLLGLLPYTIYAVILVKKLFPYVGKEMRLATSIYIMIILCMSISALLRYPYVAYIPFYLSWTGSICFLCSDTILAYQIYAKGTHHGVMILYLMAQTLIVISYLI